MGDMIGPFRGEYRWLSNFWPCEVSLDGVPYPSVEHAYQAAKTHNKFDRQRIRNADSPGAAKRIGKTVMVQEGWKERRVNVMEYLLRQKFTFPDLQDRLLQTGDDLLAEVNEWGDRFWGVSPAGHGANTLGKLLMQIRASLHDRG